MRVDHGHVCVRANVPEDEVHAEQAGTGADTRVIFPGHGVEEWNTVTLFQDLIVGGGKETIGQTISEKGGDRS